MSRKSLVPIQLPADPVAALEAATKQYVDNIIDTAASLPLLDVVVLTANGSFTKATYPTMTAIRVRLVGGGGGGGGASATTGTGGSGGGGGAYCEKDYIVSALSTSEPVVIGGGGVGAGGANAGTAGAASTFKGMSAGGGSGGNIITALDTANVGGIGGAATGGDVNAGGGGGVSVWNADAITTSGSGGNSVFGGGGRGVSSHAATSSIGEAGRAYGAGGAGARNGGGGNSTGGDGADGVCIIEVYGGIGIGTASVVTWPTGAEPALAGIVDGTLWVEYAP